MNVRLLVWSVGAALVLNACGSSPSGGPASLALVASVGLEAGVCADGASLALSSSDPVMVLYCYRVTNTGDVALSLHDLSDDVLGVVLREFVFELAPGASVDTVAVGLDLSVVVGASTVNAAT